MKKTSFVCMTFCVIMAFCAIGLIGCLSVSASGGNAASSGNSINSSTEAKSTTTAETTTTVRVTPPTDNPLSMVGWRAWNDIITLDPTGNVCVIDSSGRLPDAAGFANTSLNTDLLRGKTLVLYFSNTAGSRFSQGRMVKLEYNRDDKLLRPVNVASLLPGGYLPAGDTPDGQGIEFLIPDDFDGKLNFTFYQAELTKLKITAFYR